MGFFKTRLFWIALVVIVAASTLPLYVSGYVLGVLTVAYYFGVFAMAWAISSWVAKISLSSRS